VIGLSAVYALTGLLFAAVAAASVRGARSPRQLGGAAFWALLALSFLAGDRLGDLGNGVLVVALVLLAGVGLGRGQVVTTSAEARRESAARRGSALFLPALIVPAVVLAGALGLKSLALGGRPLLDPAQATLVSLAIGAVAALAVALAWLRPPASAPVQEARRIMDQVGWALVLPQMLAALGAVFALSGVGAAVGQAITRVVPLGDPTVAVVAYTLGMAAFTALLGNAFAAFPVMTAAIGAPLIVGRFHGDPAVMGALGMLSGFCGTLVSPMAANFNIVPTALLDLPDRYAVIRTQAPTALLLLVVNTALMAALVYRV